MCSQRSRFCCVRWNFFKYLVFLVILEFMVPTLYFILIYRMDIDYSPTGREFVTGSYDRTVSPLAFCFNLSTLHLFLLHSFISTISHLQVRLFQYNGGHSKEIYHTKRMQRFTQFSYCVLSVVLSLICLNQFQTI